MEKLAREELGYAKTNETVFRFVGSEAPAFNPNRPSDEHRNPKPIRHPPMRTTGKREGVLLTDDPLISNAGPLEVPWPRLLPLCFHFEPPFGESRRSRKETPTASVRRGPKRRNH